MISLIVTLLLIGLLIYIIGILPLDATIMQLIRVVAIVVAVVYVLQFFFNISILPTVPVTSFHRN